MQLYNKLSSDERSRMLDSSNQRRITLSFYKYAKINDPKSFRDELFIFWNSIDVLGRIYIASEGINAQLSLPEVNLEKFIDSFKSKNRASCAPPAPACGLYLKQINY